MDTDDNGNNVLNARVRYFQNENNDELDYLNVPDVYMNSVLSSMRPNSSTPYIINFYSHGTSYSSKGCFHCPIKNLSLLEWKAIPVLI